MSLNSICLSQNSIPQSDLPSHCSPDSPVLISGIFSLPIKSILFSPNRAIHVSSLRLIIPSLSGSMDYSLFVIYLMMNIYIAVNAYLLIFLCLCYFVHGGFFPSFIYLLANFIMSLLKLWSNTLLCKCVFFSHSSVEGHLGCLQEASLWKFRKHWPLLSTEGMNSRLYLAETAT